MNTYDSELVAGMLKKCGYSETSELHNADAVFLNTCAIREKAEERNHTTTCEGSASNSFAS